MKKILVTGGSGYIGVNLIEKLLDYLTSKKFCEMLLDQFFKDYASVKRYRSVLTPFESISVTRIQKTHPYLSRQLNSVLEDLIL